MTPTRSANADSVEQQVVELRQYTLKPGQRDVLIELFDREFVESQEAVGMQLIGQFRDLDRADRFVWLRGFSDMVQRRDALTAFYGGPVWMANWEAANATMIDSDNVLLLRPVPGAGFDPLPLRPAPRTNPDRSVVAITICSLDQPADIAVVASDLLPALAATTAPPLATFVEEPSENTFPRLPVRTGEHVVVWVQRVAGPQEDVHRASLDIARKTLPNLVATPVQLSLEPTPRSRLR